GASSGGVRATGGMATAGRGASGGFPGTGGVLTGSCNPNFCPSTPQGAACCVTTNGPCGVNEGNGCIDRAPGVCAVDSDCPALSGPTICSSCPDGSCAPARPACVTGVCTVTFDPCPPSPACNPAFCPSVNGFKPCCVNGGCGLDYGNGCLPQGSC